MIGGAVTVSEEVADLHRRALVIDLHNDLLTKISHVSFDLAARHRPAAFWNPFRLDLDLPKIRAGGIDALGCALFAGFRLDAARRFWRQLDHAGRLVREHPQDLALVDTADAVDAARACGRTGLFLGVEGSYVVEKDVESDVARLAAAGVRYLGPLWERDSAAGSSCRSRNDAGLTDLGQSLVRACNRHGLLLDVAHASPRTFWQLHELSRTPVFSSHSGASGVHPHPRNLDDDQIRAVASRGGVVGVIFVAAYLGKALALSPLAHIADHIEHVVRVGGEDTVALGSDYDGFMPLARGMRDAADLPRLTQVLWDRGWREPALRKLLGENALRLFRQTWQPRPTQAAYTRPPNPQTRDS
jgi:membrane dipeptidase